MSQTVPVPPAQLINGPTVIISGPALLEVSALLQLGIKHLKVREAIAPPPRLLAMAGLVKQAADQYRAMSDVGPRPRTSGPDPASSSQADPHEVTASQAAQMLGITDRHVRRIAPQLGIVCAKPLMFSTAAVEAYTSRRTAEGTEIRRMTTTMSKASAIEQLQRMGVTYVCPEEWKKISNAAQTPARRPKPVMEPVGHEVISKPS